MPGYGDLSDRLLVGHAITTAPLIVPSRLEGWDQCDTLVAELRVTAAVGAGDSLVVKVQHSINKLNWHDLLVFSSILGNTAMPFAEVKQVGKGAALVAWGPLLRALATPAGGTPAFTVADLRIIGS